jgi:prostaglandin-H2 D-isomerase / glutathione transferase
MPLGQVPVLEYDGTEISQSLTIARFLAREFGLAGKTNLEQAQADMIIDAGNDLANSTSIQLGV